MGSKSSGGTVPTWAVSQAETGSGSIPFGARATALASPGRTRIANGTRTGAAWSHWQGGGHP